MKDTTQNENLKIHAIYFITKPTKIKHEILSKYIEKLYYLSRVATRTISPRDRWSVFQNQIYFTKRIVC